MYEKKSITNEFVNDLINKINNKLPENGKIIYLTLGGAHLFGLDTPKSDYDIKGIFINSTFDTCVLKPSFLDFSTNTSKNKNTEDDIDIDVFSLHKYFHMVDTGDTNAYDLLFSMFQPNTILYETPESNIIKNHYRELLSTNSKGFLGYVVSQTKKYGVKGERYKSLQNVYDFTKKFVLDNNIDIHKDNISSIISPLLKSNISHTFLIDKTSIQRRVGGGLYLSVLNKEYGDTLKFDYFLKRLEIRLKDYGARSQSAANGIDFKSLSHAYRIILEFEELLKNHFITFPLEYASNILRVKKGNLVDFNNDYKEILLFLDNKVNKIEKLLLEAGLPDKVHPLVFNKIFIKILSIVENSTVYK